MKEYKTEQIRNVVLLGHGGTGKTSLSEAALFSTGGINRLGKVDDGTTTSDFEPDEVKRKISISLSLIPCEWSGHKINIIDTPGYADFVGEVKSGIAAADLGVIVVDAVSGVQVGTVDARRESTAAVNGPWDRGGGVYGAGARRSLPWAWARRATPNPAAASSGVAMKARLLRSDTGTPVDVGFQDRQAKAMRERSYQRITIFIRSYHIFTGAMPCPCPSGGEDQYSSPPGLT